MRAHLLLPLVSLTLMTVGCQPTPLGGASTAPAPQRSLEDVTAQARRDLQGLKDIIGLRQRAAAALGRMNAMLEGQAYWRRFPRSANVEALEAQLLRHANALGMQIGSIAFDAPPQPQSPFAETAKAHETVPVEKDTLRQVVKLRFDLKGAPDAVLRFLQTLPQGVERLVLVTALQRQTDGATIFAEAYYEPMWRAPIPKIGWLGLQERLSEAGIRQAPTDGSTEELARIVAEGARLLPDAEEALRITSDFPLWQARLAFFIDRAQAVQSVKAREMVGL